jgi:hypothetical protein
MRPYAPNSPPAAARIIALSMLADGHVSQDELRLLHQTAIPEALGLDAHTWEQVLIEVCEDLQLDHRLAWVQACQLDPRTLEQVLDEITDPAMRRRLLAVCCALVECDGMVTEGEWTVLSSVVNRWCLHYEVVAGQPPLHPEHAPMV